MKVKCQVCSPTSVREREEGKKKKSMDMLFYWTCLQHH